MSNTACKPAAAGSVLKGAVTVMSNVISSADLAADAQVRAANGIVGGTAEEGGV